VLIFKLKTLNNESNYYIRSASQRLKAKLAGLPVFSVGISEYNQQYISAKLNDIDSSLDIYCRILNFALQDNHSALSDFTLVDYGGGSGIFSLLAKEAGIGKVIYNDIYDVSCSDILQISKHINIPIDHVICGDVDVLIRYLHDRLITVNAIASFDVIEHIYDTGDHFKKLSVLQTAPLKLIYGSGANMKNYWKVRAITKIQIADEYHNKIKTWGHKERDSLQSFLEIRKQIIRSYAPQIESPEVECLAKNMRGLMKDDIEKYTGEFLSIGKISYQTDHPTNTCDPLTGNWSEHLIDLNRLKKILNSIGFSVEIIPGYYTTDRSLPKKFIKYILNCLIRLLKHKGMFIAPYYILIIQKQS
jgi:hypothetical protein